ncbi:hypothetical protein Patl1_09468 [Pistacia atlantica]|uniref:Uncharacterized protein n=1 Tax=Pistacia atlantica TaxID=434234 RepID=A0ACC1AFG6_9ROSI|nr:hypothetical protein Patl1_09468 [Pistacia atlantica]
MGSSPISLQTVLCAPGVSGRRATAFRKDGLTEFMQSIMFKKQELKEPFYVLDLGVVVSLFDKWTRSLPTVRPFYAVKCNPEPALLGALAALGSNFDCASRAEIEAVLALGAKPDPDRLCKPVIKAPEDGGARCPLGPKYGALPDEIAPLLQAALAAGLSVTGVSFHIGSGDTHSRAYHGAIAAAKTVFETATRFGVPKMNVLNIGGGFTADPKFDEAASVVKSALQTYFPNQLGLSVISEPGRFFAESAFTLATNVIGKRVRDELREYWINDGIYGSMNCILYDHATVTCTPLACTTNRANPTCKGLRTYNSTVFGPTCDALDTVLTGYQLPATSGERLACVSEYGCLYGRCWLQFQRV